MGARSARWARVRFEIVLGGFVEEGIEGSARGSHFPSQIQKPDSGSSGLFADRSERKGVRREERRRTPKPESSCLITTRLCFREPLYDPFFGTLAARTRRARRSVGERA